MGARKLPVEDGRAERKGAWVPVSPPGWLPAGYSQWIIVGLRNDHLLGEAAKIWGFPFAAVTAVLTTLQRSNIF